MVSVDQHTAQMQQTRAEAAREAVRAGLAERLKYGLRQARARFEPRALAAELRSAREIDKLLEKDAFIRDLQGLPQAGVTDYIAPASLPETVDPKATAQIQNQAPVTAAPITQTRPVAPPPQADGALPGGKIPGGAGVADMVAGGIRNLVNAIGSMFSAISSAFIAKKPPAGEAPAAAAPAASSKQEAPSPTESSEHHVSDAMSGQLSPPPAAPVASAGTLSKKQGSSVA